MLVSVSIPVYNGGKYIEEALKSISGQTYEDLEIIVVYDRSDDDTLDKIHSAMDIDDRIRLLEFDGLHSVAKSLNEGLKAATGDYIVRMDADDIAVDYRIEHQIAYMLSHPDVAICGSGFRYIVDDEIKTEEYYPLESTADIRMGLMLRSQFNHPTVMLNAKLIKEDLHYNEEYRAEDYDLWSRIAFKNEVVNLHEVLLNYRLLDNSATTRYADSMHQDKARIQRSNYARLGIDIHIDEDMMLGASSVEELEAWEACLAQAADIIQPSYQCYRQLIYQLYNATSQKLKVSFNNDVRFSKSFHKLIEDNNWQHNITLRSYLRYLGKMIKYKVG